MIPNPPSQLPVIGWREWIKLPDFETPRIKAKVDTGARSSSLHASDIHRFDRDGVTYVRFNIHPYHRRPERFVTAESKVIDFRKVRSSSGAISNRPVISTAISLLGQTWDVELTLASREEMGFRMLLGREAFRGKFLVDAGKSFYGGKPKRKRKQKKDEE
ncbi:MAG: hypothetical protein ACI87E_002401 [Mariniblastus sp.]|jgi:hypothetical protein